MRLKERHYFKIYGWRRDGADLDMTDCVRISRRQYKALLEQCQKHYEEAVHDHGVGTKAPSTVTKNGLGLSREYHYFTGDGCYVVIWKTTED